MINDTILGLDGLDLSSDILIDMTEYEDKTVIMSFEIETDGIETALSISDIWVDGVNQKESKNERNRC